LVLIPVDSFAHCCCASISAFSLRDASQHDTTPLLCAAKHGRLAVAAALMAQGADIDARDKVRPPDAPDAFDDDLATI
jgi:hypothetical protein